MLYHQFIFVTYCISINYLENFKEKKKKRKRKKDDLSKLVENKQKI